MPRGARVRLWLVLAYLAVPIDVIPDFIPVIGYADDAIVVSSLCGASFARLELTFSADTGPALLTGSPSCAGLLA